MIPSAVDLSRFSFDAEARAHVRASFGLRDEPLAIFVGGDWGRKGLAIAIEAVARTGDWHLLVAGSGDVPRFQRMAADLGAADRVHFSGYRAKTVDLYSASDVFLLPTAYETFSLVSFEAAAVGLPLLVTRVHGPDELVVDGENGWYVKPDPREIASRLRQLADDPELRRRMGEAARAARRSYSWGDNADAYERLFRRLEARGVNAG